MSKSDQIEVRDYTTKKLYEATRGKQDASDFYSNPSTSVHARIQQLDAQIERKVNTERKSGILGVFTR